MRQASSAYSRSAAVHTWMSKRRLAAAGLRKGADALVVNHGADFRVQRILFGVDFVGTM